RIKEFQDKSREAAEDHLSPRTLQGFPYPCPGEHHLVVGEEEPGIAEAKPPGGDHQAFCTLHSLEHRFCEVVVPRLDETGGPEYRYSRKDPDLWVQSLCRYDLTLRDRERDFNTGEADLPGRAVDGIHDALEGRLADGRVPRAVPGGVPGKPADPRPCNEDDTLATRPCICKERHSRSGIAGVVPGEFISFCVSSFTPGGNGYQEAAGNANPHLSHGSAKGKNRRAARRRCRRAGSKPPPQRAPARREHPEAG